MAEDDDKKKGIALLIAKKMGAEKGEESEGPDYEDLAQEILDAHESKSAGDLAKALKAFVRACKGGE